MNGVFIYWDNSNIFHEAQRLAEERLEGPNARYRVRINFDNIWTPFMVNCQILVNRWVKKGSIHGKLPNISEWMGKKGGHSQFFSG